MNFLKKWGPTLTAVGGTVLTAVTPTLQHGLSSFAGKHPSVFAGIGAALGIIAHLWPSPVSK